MNKHIILASIAIYAMCSCSFDIDPPKRLYRTKIKKEGIELDWFYYSLISNTTSDYITATNKNITDTILVSDLVTDVYIKKDTIFIELYGKPSPEKKHLKEIPNQIFDYYIKIDSIEKRMPIKMTGSFIESSK